MKLHKNLQRAMMCTGLAASLVLAQSSGSQSGTATTPQAADQTSTSTTQSTQTGKSTTNNTTTRGTSKGADHMGHTAGAAGASDQSMVSQQDRTFMTHAAQGGMAEVQLAQMAQQKASSQEVKDYARKLEQDHTQANNKLKAIAQERQVDLPSDIGEHQAMVTKLNALSGAEFDKAYMKMMVSDHKKDIKEFERTSNRSIDTDLKTFASSTLPTLREHLTAAQSLNSGSTRSRSADTAKTSTTDKK